MHPCKTGDQPYSDASPNGECSLAHLIPTYLCGSYQLTQDVPTKLWLEYDLYGWNRING